jgi:hypothetical protein
VIPNKPTKRTRVGTGSQPPLAARTLESLVGSDVYRVWVAMLSRVGPDGRTHRLAVLIASMLQHASCVASERGKRHRELGTIGDRELLIALQVPEPGGENEELKAVVVRLFDDAGVPHSRTNRRGDEYSIIDASIEEFIRWFDMPWEG